MQRVLGPLALRPVLQHGAPRLSDRLVLHTPAAIILFFFLVFVGNTLLGFVHRSWMLSRAELALIYIMWIVATSIPEWGLTAFLLPDITSVIYYATPENNWAELLHPLIPDWIIPTTTSTRSKTSTKARRRAGHPLGAVVVPAGVVGAFRAGTLRGDDSIVVVLRKQWIENERLIFPLVQLPIAMLQKKISAPEYSTPFSKIR